MPTRKRWVIAYAAKTAFVNHFTSIEHSSIEDHFMPSLQKLCSQIIIKCNHRATVLRKISCLQRRKINLNIHKWRFYWNFKQELCFSKQVSLFQMRGGVSAVAWVSNRTCVCICISNFNLACMLTWAPIWAGLRLFMSQLYVWPLLRFKKKKINVPIARRPSSRSFWFRTSSPG